MVQSWMDPYKLDSTKEKEKIKENNTDSRKRTKLNTKHRLKLNDQRCPCLKVSHTSNTGCSWASFFKFSPLAQIRTKSSYLWNFVSGTKEWITTTKRYVFWQWFQFRPHPVWLATWCCPQDVSIGPPGNFLSFPTSVFLGGLRSHNYFNTNLSPISIKF